MLSMAGASSRLRRRAAPSPGTSTASRARRQRKRISYNEDDTDWDDFERTLDLDGPIESPPAVNLRRTRARPAVPIRTSPRSTGKREAPNARGRDLMSSAKRQKRTVMQTKHEQRDSDQMVMQLTGKAMPWTTLPYHVLASILVYASNPLIVSVAGDVSPSVPWLLRMALVCKAFTEPALSALYLEPPLHAPRQIHSLTTMLQNQSATSTINYRGKIRYLSMSAVNGLLKDPHALEAIISLAPQLRGIALGVHSSDPKICRLYSVITVHAYPADLSMFFTMTKAGTKLHSWTWNRTLSYHYQSLSQMKEVHQSTPFTTLKSLSFIDFHLPAMVDFNGTESGPEEALADTLSALPSLQRIQFSLADIVNERLMPLLPGNLQTVVLTSCYNLFSPALETFLLAKGQNIRDLVLSHNQSLNLSFLTVLSRACPKLETLEMNLLYYNSHTTFNDSAPRFDSLLGEGEQPSWPTSLRRIELLQLRRWKTPAAERFFSSIVDSSRSLQNLRHIEIKASVDESSWRDRITFRDKWVRRLNEVFLRRSPPPKHYFQSIAAYRTWKTQQARAMQGDGVTIPTQSMQHSDPSASGLATKPTIMATDSDSDTPLSKVRRSARLPSRKKGVYNESDSDNCQPKAATRQGHRGHQEPDEDTTLNSEATSRPHQQKASNPEEEQTYIQGLCNTVDIVIDNLRPTEEQLHESDFLDEERSGDEDWDGNDDDDGDDGRYAW